MHDGKEERRRSKSKFSFSIFSTVRRVIELWGYVLHKNEGSKFFCKNEVQVGMGLNKGQKQERMKTQEDYPAAERSW